MTRVKKAAFHFSRGQNRKSRSLVFLCSETAQKHLLRRLSLNQYGLAFLTSISQNKTPRVGSEGSSVTLVTVHLINLDTSQRTLDTFKTRFSMEKQLRENTAIEYDSNDDLEIFILFIQ